MLLDLGCVHCCFLTSQSVAHARMEAQLYGGAYTGRRRAEESRVLVKPPAARVSAPGNTGLGGPAGGSGGSGAQQANGQAAGSGAAGGAGGVAQGVRGLFMGGGGGVATAAAAGRSGAPPRPASSGSSARSRWVRGWAIGRTRSEGSMRRFVRIELRAV
jgi:hypothetical protein